jgi:hypothetical protein
MRIVFQPSSRAGRMSHQSGRQSSLPVPLAARLRKRSSKIAGSVFETHFRGGEAEMNGISPHFVEFLCQRLIAITPIR